MSLTPSASEEIVASFGAEEIVASELNAFGVAGNRCRRLYHVAYALGPAAFTASLTPDAELNRKMALIPVVNVSMLIKEGMMGNVDPGLTAMTMGVNLILAAICLWLVFRMFRRESVLFKI